MSIRIDETAEWAAVAAHAADLEDRHLRDLFAADPGRGEDMTEIPKSTVDPVEGGHHGS